MKQITLILLLLAVVRVSHAALLDKPWPAPDFSMTDQDGQPISSADLRGHVYVVDFIFTTCAGPCPIMTSKLVDLVGKVKDPNIRFVSFTVDPKTDTPTVLKAYAKDRGATDPRIHFATGPEEEIQRIARGMLLAFRPGDASHRIIHSDRFMLVDEKGQVRGTYRPLDPESFDELIKDIRTLSPLAASPMMKRFPAINASLNALSGLFLLVGLAMIKTGRWRLHMAAMITAVTCSVAFLASYLTYHYLKTQQGVLLTKFPEHWLRPVYLAILTSHTILAAVVLPLILVTVTRAARRRWDRHMKIAWPTYLIWLYVSVTGVVVYVMLYQLAPGLQ